VVRTEVKELGGICLLLTEISGEYQKRERERSWSKARK